MVRVISGHLTPGKRDDSLRAARSTRLIRGLSGVLMHEGPVNDREKTKRDHRLTCVTGKPAPSWKGFLGLLTPRRGMKKGPRAVRNPKDEGNPPYTWRDFSLTRAHQLTWVKGRKKEQDVKSTRETKQRTPKTIRSEETKHIYTRRIGLVEINRTRAKLISKYYVGEYSNG
ncbi:hypothetical protein R1flu_012367 [Riccia fluitans]|uniref:Ribosomal protein S8 n=1 Tax=Riccia fluitans TaxID=41844 RepID=A0ABD1ZBE3_9MARC